MVGHWILHFTVSINYLAVIIYCFDVRGVMSDIGECYVERSRRERRAGQYTYGLGDLTMTTAAQPHL
jgi:hypothetical protein